MGDLLSRPPQRNINKMLYIQLRQNKLKDIFECLETINEHYPSQNYFTLDEFDDVFGPLLPDTQVLFEYICEKSKDGLLLVEIYEVLACFTLFTSDSFQEKAHFLFTLFDFDRSNSIELKELVMTFQAILRVLCKISGLPIPSFETLESLSTNCFYKIDKDLSNSIDFNEFFNWAQDRVDLQEFLLKFTGSQTIAFAKKRYENFMSHFNTVYDLVKDKETQEVLLKDLRSVINKDLSNVDQNATDHFWTIMRNSVIERKLTPEERRVWTEERKKLKHGKDSGSQTINPAYFEESLNYPVEKSTYTDLIRAWVAFSAADVSNYNMIVIGELRLLLWVFEGQDPNEFYLKTVMREMDSNNSGVIDRKEWLNYLCAQDNESGGQVFRTQLKKLFNQYDKDKSGTLSFKECKMLLEHTFKEYLTRTIDEKSLGKMKNAIADLTKDILSEIDDNSNGQLEWYEFKLFLDKSMEKTEKLKQFFKDFN